MAVSMVDLSAEWKVAEMELLSVVEMVEERVGLMADVTEYCLGWILAAKRDRHLVVHLAASKDRKMAASSVGLLETKRVDRWVGWWANYLVDLLDSLLAVMLAVMLVDS